MGGDGLRLRGIGTLFLSAKGHAVVLAPAQQNNVEAVLSLGTLLSLEASQINLGPTQ